MRPTRLVILAAVVAWCAAGATSIGNQQVTTPASGAALSASHALFAHSEDCVACHNNLTTPHGDDVSIGVTWRSTMMANSARDPYWQASVRRETMDHRSKSAVIQAECAACHMPMAARVARAAGMDAEVFANLPGGGATAPTQKLAADGVSCTVCHQIADEQLGAGASFNGRFVMTSPRPGEPRPIFGPFRVDAGRTTIMHSVTGFRQVESQHVTRSELCATCHTLITEAFGPDGEVIGSLPEQMNFQEWQHSDFPGEGRSCQSCHMPVAQGPVRASSVLGDARDSLARHVFVGGNAFMVRMLDRFRDELGVTALPAEMDATARETVRQLQEDTATVTIASTSLTDNRLAVDVDVRNLTGHKYPTGYPARRTWLHVTVRDVAGATVFESGAVERTGAIGGNDSDGAGTTFEPHYEDITQSDQVQIYEAVLGDWNGVPTTGLLTATQYLKDNRLLPRGFDKRTADAMIAVHGGAERDGDFAGGGDRVRYAVAVQGSGPFSVDVELLYQSIGFRWASNLSRYDAPEPKRFLRYYDAMAASSSVIVSTVHAIVR